MRRTTTLSIYFADAAYKRNCQAVIGEDHLQAQHAIAKPENRKKQEDTCIRIFLQPM
jgi:hypothetical protein